MTAVLGLVNTGSVTLHNLSRFNQNSKTTNQLSLEQNARRLLDNLGVSPEEYAKIIVNEIFDIDTLEIAIDRTNWERGTFDINYFVVSFIWNNVAIPLYWELLDNKGGSSSDAQRIKMIQWVVDLFGVNRISNVYADREFPSAKFFSFLNFDTRICANIYQHSLGDCVELINSYKIMQLIQTGNSIFPSQSLDFLKLQNRLQIVYVFDSLILIEVLETQQCKIYQLNLESHYTEIAQLIKQPRFMLTPKQLSLYFKNFNVRTQINFVQRCKGSTLVSYGNLKIKLNDLHQALLRHGSTVATTICRAFGQRLYISARRNELDEMVYIVTNQAYKDPFKIYARRWFIETMFGKFKTLGFNLESTHLTKLNRLASLLHLVAIAYSCCCKIGHVVHSFIKPIKIKRFKKNGQPHPRFQYSIFKLGFELLKNFLNNHLFVGTTSAKLLQQIFEFNGATLKINKRSHAYEVVKNFQ